MDEIIILAIAGLVAALMSVVALRFYLNIRRLRRRFAPIVDIDAELAKVKRDLDRSRAEQQQCVEESERQRVRLAEEYQQAKSVYDRVRAETSLLEENLEDMSFGLYRPHFDFATSGQYKVELESLRDRERQLIRQDRAAVCSAQWTVAGSAKEGARMAKQNMKLVLRAFNGECDAALAKVAWNNIMQMEERIRKSFDAINKLGTVLQVSISREFVDLKVRELRLTHEYEEKRYQEQEEQRRIREQMREEEKAQREIERARDEAEREEARFEKALEKARSEAAKATGRQLEELNERIRTLEGQLQEAQHERERAVSRAQLTKSGHVYVISNTGSFGENVYKVGMTRRLEPYDRIRELGDASVPFPFDVHALIYSENAPDLECALHQFLAERRVNLVNPRKEFFEVPLDEIERFAKNRGLGVEFTMLAEAKEYRETMSMRAKAPATTCSTHDAFPTSLFDAPITQAGGCNEALKQA